MQKRHGNGPTRGLNELRYMRGPAHGDGGGGHGVFEDQAPAYDPGKQLAQYGIAVSVGAARCRNDGSHLGIAECGAGADHAAEKE